MSTTEVTGDRRRTRKDYGLGFKLQVVDEVEKGELSYKQAQAKYGIQGRSTVLVWLRKHGRLAWKKEDAEVKQARPDRRIQELESKVRRLERDKEILNRAIDIASDMFGQDIRKKYMPQLLKATVGEAAPGGAQQPGSGQPEDSSRSSPASE